MSIDMCVFSSQDKPQYVSTSKLCVSIAVHFFLGASFLCVKSDKLAKTLSDTRTEVDLTLTECFTGEYGWTLKGRAAIRGHQVSISMPSLHQF